VKSNTWQIAVVRFAQRVNLESAPGVMQIDEHAAVFLGDRRERAFDNRVAIAGRGPEHVPGEAMRMHAHQRGAGFRDVAQLAAHQRHVQFVVRVI
jgi:hypothetical protein